ncbi:MAG: bacteriohemerythrin [Proteobacteria bacterium]|nr:bacteriohemerythrin [Pseudomonadota bacterium]MDA1308754.1 bacteriohemerythrin [Pseudomonadota bacterium]
MTDQLIEWRDDFRIGIAEIDHEHAEMIALINQLHRDLGANAGLEPALACLGEIHSRITAHFALEEKLMRTLGYPRLTVHKEDHETLLDQILDILDRVEDGDLLNYEESLSEALNQWFGQHFRDEDARLHHFLQASG